MPLLLRHSVDHLLDPAGIHDINKVALVIKIDIATGHNHKRIGTFGVAGWRLKLVNRAAWLIQVTPRRLRLVRILNVVPIAGHCP